MILNMYRHTQRPVPNWALKSYSEITSCQLLGYVDLFGKLVRSLAADFFGLVMFSEA